MLKRERWLRDLASQYNLQLDKKKKSGHYAIKTKDDKLVATASSTPGDWRTDNHLEAEIRRAILSNSTRATQNGTPVAGLTEPVERVSAKSRMVVPANAPASPVKPPDWLEKLSHTTPTKPMEVSCRGAAKPRLKPIAPPDRRTLSVMRNTALIQWLTIVCGGVNEYRYRTISNMYRTMTFKALMKAVLEVANNGFVANLLFCKPKYIGPLMNDYIAEVDMTIQALNLPFTLIVTVESWNKLAPDEGRGFVSFLHTAKRSIIVSHGYAPTIQEAVEKSEQVTFHRTDSQLANLNDAVEFAIGMSVLKSNPNLRVIA